ncbi:MAG TPA: glycosyltransferase family 2 protein [Terriglobia bacterium]|jgi:biofilm PGA synthesis N-glycosyltransferase PgaC|nr:glycosyltransferase family 2 protein [Terriglobia bacterium]
MKALFWASTAFVLFTYLGYPAWLCLRARWKALPVRRAAISPSISVIVAAHNEAGALPAKLANLEELDYPPDRMEVVVASDGSSDGTNAILEDWSGPRRKAIILARNQGKAAALNHAVQAAGGEILLFTDARQRIAADALRVLAESFADPAVGCVSGELILEGSGRDAASGGLGLYWQIEKSIRRWESASGSVVGVTGALYAARKDLVPLLPPGTILDDVFIPLNAARQGKRILFDGRALSYDRLADDRREFWRKVRTLTGNYQLLRLAPWLLTTSNGIRFRFVCHKLLRLLVPFALLGVLVSSLFLTAPIYRAALAGLVALGLGAVLSAFHIRAGVVSRLGSACSAFLVLNAAAALAFLYFVTGRRVAWTR